MAVTFIYTLRHILIMFEDYLFMFDENNLEEAVWCLTQEVLGRHFKREDTTDWLVYWRAKQN